MAPRMALPTVPFAATPAWRWSARAPESREKVTGDGSPERHFAGNPSPVTCHLGLPGGGGAVATRIGGGPIDAAFPIYRDRLGVAHRAAPGRYGADIVPHRHQVEHDLGWKAR